MPLFSVIFFCISFFSTQQQYSFIFLLCSRSLLSCSHVIINNKLEMRRMIAAFSCFSTTLEDNNLFHAGLFGLHTDEENKNNIIYWMDTTTWEQSLRAQLSLKTGQTKKKSRNEYEINKFLRYHFSRYKWWENDCDGENVLFRILIIFSPFWW